MKILIVLLMLLIALPSIGQHASPFFMGGVGDKDEDMSGGMTELPIESWVFSNGSTMPSGSYDYTESMCCSGELKYDSPTTVRNNSSGLRTRAGEDGWGVDAAPECATLLGFDCGTILSGKTIVKATLAFKLLSWVALTAGGDDLTIDIVGIMDSNFDDWVDYSSTSTSDVCYDYYDASSSSTWVTAISTYTSTAPNDGWTDSYPATGTFWGVHADTTMNSFTGNSVFTIDVTEAVKAWVAGENEGGFILFGQRSGGGLPYFYNISDATTSNRPYLEVYAR